MAETVQLSEGADSRFWLSVDVKAADECWPWLRTRVGVGYGKFFGDGRQWIAHRLSYAMHIGPIPPGMIVRHRCDNPPCCNPRHLELGTTKQNGADMARRGRSWTRKDDRRGHMRQRNRSWEVRAYAGEGRTLTRTVGWQGSAEATKAAAEVALAEVIAEADRYLDTA